MQPLSASRFAFDPEKVELILRQHIIGQDETIVRFRQQLNIIKAGLFDDRKPLLSTLFLGRTGVGKTEFVRTVAKAIHGNTNAFCRIDMNTLSQSHYSAAITGAPPGYVGSKENISLFDDDLINGTSTRPGIVLFDEIEKASTDVVLSLMNILDNGKLTLSSGNKTLKFHNCLIFMTSNLGARTINKGILSRIKHSLLGEKNSPYLEAMERHFDPEFINRIGSVCCFNTLSENHLPAIIKGLEQDLNLRLRSQNIVITLDDSVSAHLCSQGFNTQYGARAIERQFSNLVLEPLAKALLNTDSSAPRSLLGTMNNESKDERIIFIPNNKNTLPQPCKPVAVRPLQEKNNG
ncbi:MAG: AAA family ATPase [Oleibacter sp.]|nr:AAA family ATPase [Thalassolituus sp.]